MPPAKSYVIYNNKGGVGKTTLAFHTAVEMAMRVAPLGKRVLVIDMDSQYNTSSLMLGGGMMGRDVANQFNEDQRTVKALISPTEETRHLTLLQRFDELAINVRANRAELWDEGVLGPIEHSIPGPCCLCVQPRTSFFIRLLLLLHGRHSRTDSHRSGIFIRLMDAH